MYISYVCVFQHCISLFSHLNSHSRQCSPLGHNECCSTCLWILQSIIFVLWRTWSEAIKMTGSAWDWKTYVCGKTLWNSKYILIRKNWLGSCRVKDVGFFWNVNLMSSKTNQAERELFYAYLIVYNSYVYTL